MENEIAINIVRQELRWHVEHRGITDKSVDWEKGFIEGLTHIHNVLLKVHSAISQAGPEKEK